MTEHRQGWPISRGSYCRGCRCDGCKAAGRAYREENKDVIAAKQRAYREENKDVIAAKQRAYYEENKDVIAAKQRAYYEENKDVIAAKRRAYREEIPARITQALEECDPVAVKRLVASVLAGERVGRKGYARVDKFAAAAWLANQGASASVVTRLGFPWDWASAIVKTVPAGGMK